MKPLNQLSAPAAIIALALSALPGAPLFSAAPVAAPPVAEPPVAAPEGLTLAPSAEAVVSMAPGSAAPDASIRTLAGESIELHEVLRGERIVLIFYRGGW